LCAWAVYRCSCGRPDAMGDPATVRYLVDHCVAGAGARRVIAAALHVPMPAPQIADGLLVLCATNAPAMSASYLLGRITLDGFPPFFPVALLFKTPSPVLLLPLWCLSPSV